MSITVIPPVESLTMSSLWKPNVPDIVIHTIPHLQTLVYLVILLVLLILFIDHVDLALGLWPIRNLHRATNQTFINARFRRRQSGRELEDALRNGYYTCSKKGKPFAAKTELNNWLVVLPLESSSEWRNLPVDHLSFTHYLKHALQFGNHTDVSCPTHIASIHACNRKEHLSNFQDVIVSGTDEFLPSILGEVKSTEWTEFNLAQSIDSLMVQLAISWVIGPEFSRDPEFVQQMATHLVKIDQTVPALFPWPRFLWPLAWRLSPMCRGFRSNASTMKKKLIPEMRRRINMIRSGVKFDAEFSLLSTFLRQSFKDGIISQEGCSTDDEKQIDSLFMKTLFHVYEIWGPIVTIIYPMLVRIMVNPEYEDVLREEISGSLNSSPGAWYSDFLTRTPKLESFTRETLRLYSPVSVSGIRGLRKPLKLKSMNITLPAGTYISLPTMFIHTDPDIYPNPNTFDGYRFYDPISNTSALRASTISDIYLAFGQGSGVCPGRLLGVKASQIIFAKYFLNYDMKCVSKDQKFPETTVTEDGSLLLDLDMKAHIRRRQPRSSESESRQASNSEKP